MATNDFDSNFTRTVLEKFLKPFESERVLSKSVNTQFLANAFNPGRGDTVDFHRPTDYRSIRTSDGDISAETKSGIVTGKASGVVQDYITVRVDFTEADQSIKMNGMERFVDGMAMRVVTDLEVDLASFMLKNSGLFIGTMGTAVTTWSDVARAGAMARSIGIPRDSVLNYGLNPFTAAVLADQQRSLGAGGVAGGAVKSALENATLVERYAGMRVLDATTLPTVTSAAGADRTGALASNPDVTYVTAKDSMTQSLSVNAMQANLVIKAGQVVQITGRNRLNLSTRQPIVTDTGANLPFSGVVTADVTLSGAGAGTIIVSGPALFETNGQYNTVDSAPIAGDVVTVLGAASTLYQPNLFWHQEAFSIGSVPMAKLYATDAMVTTKDGLQIRVSKYADGDANKQILRFDLRPAYAALNPFFAGQSWG